MDLLVLNEKFEAVAIVDGYESFIWTDRFRSYGDFELDTTMASDIFEHMQRDRYVVNRDSDHIMIVEKILIKSDAEDGDRLTVSGRSLESILDRRIVWKQLVVKGNVEEVVEQLLKACIIEPEDSNRKIPNFVFKSSGDSKITSINVESQYTGDNLYDVISGLCEEHDIGFKITLSDDGKFVFSLYSGVDRSYQQEKNPYVVFSPGFDNLRNSNYLESSIALKNVTLIGGEGQGDERKYTSVGTASGLSRREMFTDARDLSSDNNGESMDEGDYTAQLQQRGKEKLAETSDISTFEGEVEGEMYEYGVDYDNGDIVQILDEYGHESPVRIIETVMSDGKNGYGVYPTFESIKEKGE